LDASGIKNLCLFHDFVFKNAESLEKSRLSECIKILLTPSQITIKRVKKRPFYEKAIELIHEIASAVNFDSAQSSGSQRQLCN
jgi:hypothetical protein